MKILIIRLSSIGDIVLTSPVLRCLHQQIQPEIHFLTKPAFAPIVESNPYVSKVWHYKKGIADELRPEQFDYVIDLHKNLRTLLLRWSLGRKTFSFPKLNWEKWLLVRFKINKMPKSHIVDRYLESVAALGIKNDQQGLDYFIPDKDKVQPSQYSSDFSQGYLALVVGAAHATKAIPPEELTRICSQIPYPIALIGGKAELALGQYLSDLHPHVVNLCGALSLHQSASMIQQARLVISPDTGMMHIAAALKRPIISIWGSTVPDFGMYPYYPAGDFDNIFIEKKSLACRPCSKIGFDKCPKGHFNCMRDLDVSSIVYHVSSIMLPDT